MADRPLNFMLSDHPTDLTTGSAQYLSLALSIACRLGTRDAMEGVPERPVKDVVKRKQVVTFGIMSILHITQWRGFHATALREAYRAGRRHVEVMGEQEARPNA